MSRNWEAPCKWHLSKVRHTGWYHTLCYVTLYFCCNSLNVSPIINLWFLNHYLLWFNRNMAKSSFVRPCDDWKPIPYFYCHCSPEDYKFHTCGIPNKTICLTHLSLECLIKYEDILSFQRCFLIMLLYLKLRVYILWHWVLLHVHTSATFTQYCGKQANVSSLYLKQCT